MEAGGSAGSGVGSSTSAAAASAHARRERLTRAEVSGCVLQQMGTRGCSRVCGDVGNDRKRVTRYKLYFQHVDCF